MLMLIKLVRGAEVLKYFKLIKSSWQGPKFTLVSSGGAGYDTIDVDACTENGILVVNQTGGILKPWLNMLWQ